MKEKHQKDLAQKDEAQQTLLDNIQMNQADIAKQAKQINDLKEINATLMKKLEEMKTSLQKAKKQQSKENQDKLAEAIKKAQEMESEIQVLKEMVKAGKIQVKTKDTDLQRLNIKIKRLEKTAEIRENIITQTLNTKISIKDGVPNYTSSAVSPRPFKSLTK